jgi:acetolactate synthase-1/2/3 large subunit
MIKLSDYVIDFIAQQHVRHVFLLPGGGCMHLVDSLGNNSSLQPVGMLHEQAVAIAAEAYGMYTNNLGVGLVTTGPGGTNAITGVAAAWIDSTPCLFISGQVKRSDLMTGTGVRQLGVQEVDIVSIVKPITKYAVTVMEPGSIRYHLQKALYLARSGRPGPVWLDIPLDVQGSIIDEQALIGFDPAFNEISNSSLQDISHLVSAAIRLLNISVRPLIIVGNGVRLARAENEMIELIDRLNIPVITTWKAIDMLPDIHPLFAGRAGTLGERGANFALQNADWLLCLGTRLDFSQTGFDRAQFARAAKKVVVDIDSNELNKLAAFIDIPICCNVGLFIDQFLQQADAVIYIDRTVWQNRIKEWRKKYPVVLPEYWESQDYVNPYVFIDTLCEALASNDVIVPCSAGTAAEITFQAFRVKAGQRISSNHGLGAMGFDLPASIGACLASGGKRTVCISGDGGIQLNIQELETIRRLSLPIKIFVLNNKGYSSIRATQRNYFDSHYICSDEKSGLTLPDINNLAHAYGLSSINISNNNGLRTKIEEALNTEGPVVIEILAIPDFSVAPRVASQRCEDGTMVSKPLEDLWPFLNRDEFFANMINELIDNDAFLNATSNGDNND